MVKDVKTIKAKVVQSEEDNEKFEDYANRRIREIEEALKQSKT